MRDSRVAPNLSTTLLRLCRSDMCSNDHIVVNVCQTIISMIYEEAKRPGYPPGDHIQNAKSVKNYLGRSGPGPERAPIQTPARTKAAPIRNPVLIVSPASQPATSTVTKGNMTNW